MNIRMSIKGAENCKI